MESSMFSEYEHQNMNITPEEELDELGLPKDEENHPLDTPGHHARMRRVQAWWEHARACQVESRKEMMKDHDYYDGDQWSQEDKDAVQARGQIAQVFNRIKPTIDWITGTEKKTRVDFKILPRTKDDTRCADVKTKLLKYVSDVNKSVFNRSKAFVDAVIGGVGWIDTGIKDDGEGEPLFSRYEDWRNVWYDPLSVENDLSDARFVIRAKYVDLDIACSMFPERSDAIRATAITNETYYENNDILEDVNAEAEIAEKGEQESFGSGARSRVRVIEAWYRLPVRKKVLKGQELGSLDGQEFDAEDEDHNVLVQEGTAQITDAIKMEVRCMVFTGDVLLQDSVSPYKHRRFPLVAIWGQRKKRDNSPYGAVRNIRDSQDDLNKRRSKALFILSTNQIIADEDAVEDWDELADEISRPDGIIKKRKGAELEIVNNRLLADEHVQLMAQDAEYIEATSGVTDEQLGRSTNAISGKAITARQDQGHVVTLSYFDNLRLAVQLIGEIQLSLIEQYYNEEKTIRISGEKQGMEFQSINAPDEFGEIQNDITARQADFIVDTANFSASVRQSTFETLMELSKTMPPEITIQLLDLIIDMADFPGKDNIVARIRQVTGQSDPEADQEDPQVVAEQQAKAERQAKETEHQDMMMQLEIAEKRAIIVKNQTDAKATEAGIVFDQEKLRIEKAEALNQIQNSAKELNIKEKIANKPSGTTVKANKPVSKRVQSKDTKPGRHEKGLSSNNKK